MRDVEVPVPSPPKLICGFTLKRPIARGRCCITYEATVDSGDPPYTPSNTSDVPIAVKIYLRNPNYKVAYQREVEVLKNVSASNYIVQFYSEFNYNSWYGIATELLTGTVRETFFSLKNLASEWLLHTIATNSLMGLQVLHDSKFIHGDVSLDNIMWNANTGVFCLIDFGLTVTETERFSHRVFSYDCSAPEVHTWNDVLENELRVYERAEARPTFSADIWALGITISKVLLGKRLFPEITPPKTQAEVDSKITKALNVLKGIYTEKFLNYMKIYLTWCLQLDKSQRKSAAVLLTIPLELDLLSLHIPENTFLPTPILRLENLADNPAHFTGNQILNLRNFFVNTCGEVKRTIYDKSTGYFYLEFNRSVDAESGFLELQNKTYQYRTLIIRFDYPERFSILLNNNQHVHYNSDN